MSDLVQVSRTGSVATLTLNRPESLNALNPELGEGLRDAVAEVGRDPSVRAVVLTGAGTAFCAGGDLRFFAACEEPRGRFFGLLIQSLNRIILDLRRLPKPVIAAINGVTSGAGLSLAMACDLRLASDTAKFKQAYTSVGLVPDGGWTMLVTKQIGMAKAAELALLDPLLDAPQALALGLVNQVVPAATLAEQAAAAAARLAAGPTATFARVKELFNRAMLPGLAEQLELEREAIMAAADGADFREGVAAFLEKRAPRFSGR
ncbi:MAG: enoyl-CoA hydratase/isomerase family protein [Symbiobacteriia bacterium]